MKFTKKELEIINKVLELEDLEPEKTHLYVYILRPLNELMFNYNYSINNIENEYLMESIKDELKCNPEICGKKIYNRRLRALGNMFEDKILK